MGLDQMGGQIRELAGSAWTAGRHRLGGWIGVVKTLGGGWPKTFGFIKPSGSRLVETFGALAALSGP